MKPLLLLKSRALSYVLLVALIILIFLPLKKSEWTGNQELHTLLEVSSTILAFFVGVVALIRYYTKKETTILLLGVGFLGTGLLEAYHAAATSSFYSLYFPSSTDSLIAWSSFSSRIFLSVFMAAGILAWRHEMRTSRKLVRDTVIYIETALLALINFVFFSFIELPSAYAEGSLIGRPTEFIPGFFFLLAFIGYIEQGKWKTDHFDYTVTLFLVTGIATQFFVNPLSTHLFDSSFHYGQILKIFGYSIVFLGLLVNTYFLFKEAENSRHKLALQNLELTQAKDKLEKAKHRDELSRLKLEKALKETKKSQIELEKMNKIMVGREMKMIELKQEIQTLKKTSS